MVRGEEYLLSLEGRLERGCEESVLKPTDGWLELEDGAVGLGRLVYDFFLFFFALPLEFSYGMGGLKGLVLYTQCFYNGSPAQEKGARQRWSLGLY